MARIIQTKIQKERKRQQNNTVGEKDRIKPSERDRQADREMYRIRQGESKKGKNTKQVSDGVEEKWRE